MSTELGIAVQACDTADEALAAADTVLLATKSPQPVIDGSAFRPGAVVLSIGSTRPDLRELDNVSLARAESVLVDAVEQVLGDSGDIMSALETKDLSEERVVPLATLVAEDRVLPRPSETSDRDLSIFKSAGTALQDLALARGLYQRACRDGRGREVGDVSRLKPFT